MTKTITKAVLLGAATASLGGCFNEGAGQDWGITDQLASTPIEFKTWRICKWRVADATLRDCVQTTFSQDGKTYVFSPHGNARFPKAARIHVTGNNNGVVQIDRYRAYAFMQRRDQFGTSGKVYFIYPVECSFADKAGLTAAEKAVFTKTYTSCEFKPGASMAIKERVIQKVAIANKTGENYVMFEPGAKVSLYKDGRLQDGADNSGLPADIKSKANQWLERVSRNWFVNRYDKHSVSSVTLVSGNYWNGQSVLRVAYTQNNGKYASARIRMENGQPKCFDYGDITGCRPYR